MKKLFLMCLLLSLGIRLHAQTEEKQKEVSLSAGLTNWDGWKAGIGFAYYPRPWMGLSVGVDFMSAFHSRSFMGKVPGTNLLWATDDRVNDEDGNSHPHERILLSPSLVFRTPKWNLSANQHLRVSLSVEPGVYLTLPNASVDVDYLPDVESGTVFAVDSRTFKSKGGQWLFEKIDAGVNFHLEEFSFGLKYGFSNLDFWSDYRKIRIEGEALGHRLPHRKYTHSLMLYAAFGF